MVMKAFLGTISVLFGLLLVSGVYAVPLFSTEFYGTATVGGNPVKAGYIITAIINDTEKGSVIVEEDGIYGGAGGTEPKLIVNPGETGDTIIFSLNGHQATETAIFDSEIHNLNLTFPSFCGDGYCNNDESCSSCSEDCGACPPSGSETPPSGGSGGFVPPPETCTEDWSCTEWSMCVNGEQTRTCTDANACGTTENKPAETQECMSPLPKVCTTGQRSCLGDNVMECDDNEWIVVKSCKYGCSAGECLTKQQNHEVPQEPLKKEIQRNPITGLYLNPVAIYVTFLVILAVMGGVLVLKFH